jgi:DNA polymerase I-like protein with 3'-5' exonuclease and polymerase domains
MCYPIYSLDGRSRVDKDYKLITKDNLNALLAELDSVEIVAFDTETTGLDVRIEKVIGFSITCIEGSGWYLPCYVWDKTLQSLLPQEWELSIAKDLLNELCAKKLIMHNASFDVRVTYNFFGINLLPYLHADTQLMKHTLQEEGPFALKDNAVEFASQIGLDRQDAANQEQLELEQNVKANGGKWIAKSKEMYKADLAVLSKYAIADTDITLRLFNFFNKELQSQNLLDFFYKQEVMPLYKMVTIKMEHRGVYIDMMRLTELMKEISDDLVRFESVVVDSLTSLPEWDDYLDSVLEEILISNKGSFAQALCFAANLDLPLSNNKYSLTKKTISALEESLYKQFLITGDSSLLSNDDIKEVRLAIYKKSSESSYLINIQSKAQLAKLIFDCVGIKPLSKTEKGSPQFDGNFIDSISDKHEWANNLKVYNKLVKIRSSYYQRFLDHTSGGIYYPSFKQHGTSSGRYSSDFQQLPRPKDEDSVEHELVIKYNDSIRELVIPPSGYVFVDDDYESLEPRCFADDAGDISLIKIFTDSLDMYSVVAIMAENITDASADKKSPDFLKKKYPQKRQNAKAYALGLRYGMKAFKLSKSLDISIPEAQMIIDNYFTAFPGLKGKMDSYLMEVKTTGKVTSKFGRVRHLPRAAAIYRKYGDAILEYKNLRGISSKTRTPMKDLELIRKEYNNLLNNALNFPIQSAATSIVNRAAIAMSEMFLKEKLDAWVSLQIHDQIVVTCSLAHVTRVKEIVQDAMENTNKLAMPLIAIPAEAYNLREGH